jgi:anti-sigma factor RsiW
LSKTIKAQATRHLAPPVLRERIVSALNQAEPATAVPPRRRFQTLWQQWGAMGAAFACGVIASLALGTFYAAPSDEDRLSQEVIGGHLRSLMVAHLADVASTDQHTVKPWFSGKLDFSPPVHDLANQGFPLMGGRLDYLDQRRVAALVYRRQQHTINLFVWPSGDKSTRAVKSLSRQGFNMTDWSDSGMQFWAISDLGPGELQTFTQLLRQQYAQTPPG